MKTELFLELLVIDVWDIELKDEVKGLMFNITWVSLNPWQCFQHCTEQSALT